MMCKHNSLGYILLELLVVLALIGILATVVIPSFSLQIQKNRITSHANQLQSVFKFARSEAAKREKQIELLAEDKKWTVQVTETGHILRQFTVKHDSIIITGLADLSISETGSTTNTSLLITIIELMITFCVFMLAGKVTFQRRLNVLELFEEKGFVKP